MVNPFVSYFVRHTHPAYFFGPVRMLPELYVDAGSPQTFPLEIPRYVNASIGAC